MSGVGLVCAWFRVDLVLALGLCKGGFRGWVRVGSGFVFGLGLANRRLEQRAGAPARGHAAWFFLPEVLFQRAGN